MILTRLILCSFLCLRMYTTIIILLLQRCSANRPKSGCLILFKYARMTKHKPLCNLTVCVIISSWCCPCLHGQSFFPPICLDDPLSALCEVPYMATCRHCQRKRPCEKYRIRSNMVVHKTKPSIPSSIKC